MLDIRIMAHPSRRDNVLKMLADLGMDGSIVVWDDRENGGDAMYTARKAWQFPIPEGCTHRLVLQDDGELCEGFLAIAQQAAKSHPNSVVSFMYEGARDTDSRYIQEVFTVGVALMIPVCLLDDLWRFVDVDMLKLPEEFRKKTLLHDTSCIRLWMRERRIKSYTTVPTLVQHIGDESLVGIDRHRVSADYTKHPPMTGW